MSGYSGCPGGRLFIINFVLPVGKLPLFASHTSSKYSVQYSILKCNPFIKNSDVKSETLIEKYGNVMYNL